MFNYQAGQAKGVVNSASYIWQAPVAANGGKVTLQNKGSNVLYLRLIQQGQPAPGQETVTANNPQVLQMQVSYRNLKGQPINIESIKQGTDFVAEVILKNPGRRGKYDNMALT